MKTVSCFSYKGGAGRSTLALNVIPFLAEELNATPEHPLIVVDMDVDSCGLTYLFNLDLLLRDDDDGKANDKIQHVTKLFGGSKIPTDSGLATQHKLFLQLCPIGTYYDGMEDRSILCLPAKPGSYLGEKGDSYNAPNMETVKQFRKECEKVGCCGILFDSAVGNQLTAEWSNENANCILCVMRPTQQFRDGTNRFFDKFDENKSGKNIIVVPNVVPTDDLTITVNKEERHYPKYAKEAILRDFSDNLDSENNYILDLVQGECFGIPKIDRFMWQEGILYNVEKDRLNQAELIALEQYKKIAGLICRYGEKS